MLTKTKKKKKKKEKKKSSKFKNSKFWNTEKWSGDVEDSNVSTKSGVNSLDGFWENAFYGRTDGRPRHRISSTETVEQS